MQRFGHGNAKSLAALIQALRLAGAACVPITSRNSIVSHTRPTRQDLMVQAATEKKENDYAPR
jgi:divalent metal cation (Fe/Co/Zn/Cd) transporter